MFKKKLAITDSAIQAQQMRNAARIAAATERLGENYLLHPANAVRRVQCRPPLLVAPAPVLQLAA
jgi:hypothetical protein